MLANVVRQKRARGNAKALRYVLGASHSQALRLSHLHVQYGDLNREPTAALDMALFSCLQFHLDSNED